MELSSGLVVATGHATIRFPGPGPKIAPQPPLLGRALLAGGILGGGLLVAVLLVILRRRRARSRTIPEQL